MSYSGTVYCSYCSNKGHNRRGCQQFKDYLEANPNSYYALKARQNKRKASPRRCSYCHSSVHTRPTCPDLKSDRDSLVTKLAAQRKKALEKMAESGLGIGSLVKTKRGFYDATNSIAMVFSIPWRNVNGADGITLRFQFMKDGVQRSSVFSLGDGPSHLSYPLDVVGPLSAANVQAGAPAEWLNGSLYEELDYFPKGKVRRGWLFDDDTCV